MGASKASIPANGLRRWRHYGAAVFLAGLPVVWRVVALIVGFGIVTATIKLFHAGLAWALAEVAFGLACVAAVGGYLLWSELESRTRAQQSQPVQADHAERLRARLHALIGAVANGDPASYGDPREGRRLGREEFSAHFPDLIAMLDGWDRAVERHRRAPNLLQGAYARAVHEQGLDHAPFEGDAITEHLAQITTFRSLAGILEQPLDLQWRGFENADGTVELSTRYLNGAAPVLACPARSDRDAAMQRIEGLLALGQSWSEAREVREARDALNSFDKVALRDSLSAAHRREQFRVAAKCPACGEVTAESHTVSSRGVPEVAGLVRQ